VDSGASYFTAPQDHVDMIKQYLFENFRVVWDPNTLDTQLT